MHVGKFTCIAFSSLSTLTLIRYLAPVTGRIQFVEIDWEPCCDDGTLREDSAMNTWWRTMCYASHQTGRPIQYEHRLPRILEEAGFEIEDSSRYRVQTWEDQSRDAETLRRNRVARWFMTAMGDGPGRDKRTGELIPGPRGFGGLSMALFTKVAGWLPGQVERLERDLRSEVCRLNVHVYFRL